jgi:hypothetical protein
VFISKWWNLHGGHSHTSTQLHILSSAVDELLAVRGAPLEIHEAEGKIHLPITLFGHLDEAALPHASVRPLTLKPEFSLLKSKSISLLGDGGIPPDGCIEISSKLVILLGRWWWVFQRTDRCKFIN